jgi:protein-tyrosine-phosphatase
MNILVLCTGNSARSILLETLLNAQGGSEVTAFSAGSQSAGQVHPASIALLQRLGYDVAGLRSKSWDEFAAPEAPVMDAVITVCGSAAGETCPIWPGTPLRAHWGIEDPAKADPVDWDEAFAKAYARLKAQADAFFTKPVGSMNPAALQAHLNEVAAI